MKLQADAQREDIHSRVYHVVKQTLDNFILPAHHSVIEGAVICALLRFERTLPAGIPKMTVECGPQKPVREVHDLPQGAKPGDIYQPQGTKHSGLVVSSQGNGSGIVFAETAADNKDKIFVSVKLEFPRCSQLTWVRMTNT